MKLGVNIDHIAVLREARKINDPDPLDAVSLSRRAGANQITIHLREDRRHINDYDTKRIIKNSHLPVNLECAVTKEIIDIVLELKPHRITLVPENREEVTTEGGLDIKKHFERIKEIKEATKKEGIEVSLFIDPALEIVELSSKLDVEWIELHTGLYSNIYAMLFSNLRYTPHCIKELDLPREILHVKLKESLNALIQSSKLAKELGLKVAAGHGLNYQNVKDIIDIKEIEELNIGQSIIARSVFVGFENAVKEMKELIQ